jgi:mannose-6-phosphate isomerase
VIDPRLRSAAATLDDWLQRAALPLWATNGFNERYGRFEERLDLWGRPVADVPLRVMVQARQIHVYAMAAERGWYAGALERVERAFEAFQRDYYRRDGADGWVFSVTQEGAVVDATRDLYGHAFVLLAIASYTRATGGRSALALADETLAFLDRDMKAPAGGYGETLPPGRGPRQQNPHMHLFEALLALWEATADDRYRDRADELLNLFEAHFFQPASGVVLEYFDDALHPAAGGLGNIVEPGHLYEWCWLLRAHQRATRRMGTTAIIDALYEYAERHGQDDEGLIVDELSLDGSVATPSRRLWPMTEAIRCNVAEAAAGRPAAAGKAATLAARMSERFLTSQGGWKDRLDRTGTPIDRWMPASSLYHVVGAIDALSNFKVEQ